MNAKLDKLTREIEKTRAKITEAQERLKELERQRTELENTEVVALFRSADIAPGELAALLRAYKENGAAPPSAPPAPVQEYRPAGGYSSPEPDELEENTDE